MLHWGYACCRFTLLFWMIPSDYHLPGLKVVTSPFSESTIWNLLAIPVMFYFVVALKADYTACDVISVMKSRNHGSPLGDACKSLALQDRHCWWFLGNDACNSSGTGNWHRCLGDKHDKHVKQQKSLQVSCSKDGCCYVFGIFNTRHKFFVECI